MRKLIRLNLIVMSLCFWGVGIKFAMADIPIQNNDAGILGVLSIIDQNEIQVAQLAEQKFINHNVLNYARMLDIDQNKNLDHARQLSQQLGVVIEDNSSLQELRAKGEEDLAALTALDAGDFSHLYIADIIQGHAEALHWLDNQDTDNKQIKDFLEKTRERIIMHLKKAEKIQEYQNK